MFTWIQMYRHIGKMYGMYASSLLRRRQPPLFVSWHLSWPLSSLNVFVNCLCLFSDVLKGQTKVGGWYVSEPQVLREGGRKTDRERQRERRKAFSFLSVSKWGKQFLQSNSTKQTAALQHMFLSYFILPLTAGHLVNYGWMHSPHNKALINRPKWTTRWEMRIEEESGCL